MFLSLLLLVAGFVILIKGADFLVAGASSLAKRLRVSALIIGLTIVAFGTSAPELTVNVINSLQGSRSDAIYGNIVGSNIFNLFMILGITGLIYPLIVQRKSIMYEVPLSLLAVALLWFLSNDMLLFHAEKDELSRLDALVLLGGFLVFMFYVYRSAKEQSEPSDDIREYSFPMSLGMILLGTAMLIGGGYLVTDSAVGIASALGLSQKLIGLTILAVGTSLPELATSVVAAFRRSTDIALGNVIGSNIFNIFFILGINGLIMPVAFSPVLNIDIFVLAGGTVFLLISMFTLSQNRLDRWEAAIFLMLYFAYTCYLIIRN